MVSQFFLPKLIISMYVICHFTPDKIYECSLCVCCFNYTHPLFFSEKHFKVQPSKWLSVMNQSILNLMVSEHKMMQETNFYCNRLYPSNNFRYRSNVFLFSLVFCYISLFIFSVKPFFLIENMLYFNTYHQSQVKRAWLNIVPFGQRNDILRSAIPGMNWEDKHTW